jgi:hypothetical protein
MAKEPKDNAPDWTGIRVRYCARHVGAVPEFGSVARMGTGKEPCAFVRFDSDPQGAAKLCYLRDLEKS